MLALEVMAVRFPDAFPSNAAAVVVFTGDEKSNAVIAVQPVSEFGLKSEKVVGLVLYQNVIT
jgi:hypothetical protein